MFSPKYYRAATTGSSIISHYLSPPTPAHIKGVKSNGRKLSLTESGIRNAGKIFMLPLDLLIGLIAYYRRGYLRFFDYYIDCTIEKIYRAK